MLLLVVLAILAIIAFSAGFVIKWLFIVAAVLALIWLISLFAGGVGRRGSALYDAASGRGSSFGSAPPRTRSIRGPEAVNVWTTGPLPVVPERRYVGHRVAHPDSAVDRRPLHPRGEPPQVDLVGALAVPRLHRRAQGLRVWRDLPLGHVSVA